MCKSVEKYRYSTLTGLIGYSKLIIPLEPDLILFDGSLEKNLLWLNQKPSGENKSSMHIALKKRVFSLPRSKANGLNLLESAPY